MSRATICLFMLSLLLPSFEFAQTTPTESSRLAYSRDPCLRRIVRHT